MAIKTIELRNINCAHVKSIEKTLDDYQVGYVRKNYVRDENILGELIVVFEIVDEIRVQIIRTIFNVVKAIISDIVPNQHVKINRTKIKDIGDLKTYLG